jgi:DNA replication and repair protein RecF
VTVLSGDNGHGKTSLLEAIYFAATSKSFRTPRLGELVRHGQTIASVRGSFREGDAALPREQLATIEGTRRTVKLDGKRPPSLATYATRSPVVCFHARELELSSGPASSRRTVLDRVAMFLDPSSAEHHASYREAIRARQKALSLRGPDGADVGPFEALAAHHGAHLTRARARAATVLIEQVLAVFPRVGAPGLELSAVYQPGGTDDEARANEELSNRRAKDRLRGAPSFGPHRDDLVLSLDGHSARVTASQGQHRVLTIALKLAELYAIADARGVFPMLLLDDVSSELDRDRTAALLDFLGETRGQILITTTRPELIETRDLDARDRLDVTLRNGAVSAV